MKKLSLLSTVILLLTSASLAEAQECIPNGSDCGFNWYGCCSDSSCVVPWDQQQLCEDACSGPPPGGCPSNDACICIQAPAAALGAKAPATTVATKPKLAPISSKAPVVQPKKPTK